MQLCFLKKVAIYSHDKQQIFKSQQEVSGRPYVLHDVPSMKKQDFIIITKLLIKSFLEDVQACKCKLVI